MRYKLQVLGWTLIWSGLLIFGYVGWQLFVTDLINAGVQEEASVELEQTLEAAHPIVQEVHRDEFLEETEGSGDGTDPEPPVVEVPEVVDYYPEEKAEVGESFAFLNIPKVGIEGLVVYEGVDTETLKKGPGHMGRTPLPGQPGNAVLSGHRTTYGRPFFDFDLLEEGDRIEVESAIGTHVYVVRDVLIVKPTDVWVTDLRE
ncbi:MAG TPA: sortase, partial [Acidimicrobiia bacterium]|nr:sortase [Acidimicrobiia bacterium]